LLIIVINPSGSLAVTFTVCLPVLLILLLDMVAERDVVFDAIPNAPKKTS